MAATCNPSKLLKQLLLSCINGESVADRLRLRELLQTSSVADRYNALMSVRGVSHRTWPAVHMAAMNNDVISIKCMMDGFTSDQQYNIVRIQSSICCTALHYAAYNNNDAAIVMYLLSPLSIQQRYGLLKIQDITGDTALHVAATMKHNSVLQAMLSSVSPDQQKMLQNIKNNYGKTIADIISSAELFNIITAATVLEPQETQVALQKGLERNEKQIEQLKKDSQEKDRQITELTAKATTYEQEMTQLKREMKELRGQEGENRGEAKKLKLLDEVRRRQDSTNQQLATLEERADEHGARIAIAESTNQSAREDLARFSHRVEDLEENVVYREIPIGGHEQPAGEFQPMEEEEAEEHDQ